MMCFLNREKSFLNSTGSFILGRYKLGVYDDCRVMLPENHLGNSKTAVNG